MSVGATFRGRLWPLLVYGVISLLVFGIPLLGGGTRIVAADPIDAGAFMWFLAWWPHALLHGLNPFVTHALFYPDGFNLTWAAAMPGPAVVLAPVTLLFGPATTWNVIMLAAPALAAWTMYLLCLHLTERRLPSLVAGYLFGFSSYMLSNLTGAPELVLVWPLPLLVLLALRWLEGGMSSRRYVLGTAALLVALYLTSAELLATTTCFAAVALLVALALFGGQRARLRMLALQLLGALALAALAISPFLAFFLLGQHYPPGATSSNADLASFVLPTKLVALRFHPGPPYAGSNPQSYLGLPLLVLIGLGLWQRRRERASWLLAGCLAAALVATLGRHLDVRGHATGIPLPWSVAKALPVLRYAIPVRLTLFATLPAAVLAARALAGPRDPVPPRSATRAVPWLAGLAAVAFVFPLAGAAAWNTQISAPGFFAHRTYARYLNGGDHVLTIPAWGPNQWWVAAAGFPFALSAGYAGNPFPPAYTRFPAWTTLLSGQLTADYGAQLRRFLLAKRVTAIVVQQRYPGPWRRLFATTGVRPLSLDGVWLYRLRRDTPGA